MNDNKSTARIPSHYWGYLTLAVWALAYIFLLRHDPYALNSGAAKALLLTWSIADQVASPVVTFGTPDLRTLLFLPVGFLWTGSVFAAKVLTILLMAITSWLLYSWKRKQGDDESALLATGLLLIAPLTLAQIDSLSPGAFLIIAFTFGAWLDRTYRADPKSFGGWYFAQLFICAFSVSLHPIGIAYPLTLLWAWRTEPLDKKQQKYFLVGISFTVLLMLIISMGWPDLNWMQNPVTSLGTILAPHTPSLADHSSYRLTAGIIVLALLVITLTKQFRNMLADFFGRTLLLGLALGLFVGDSAWSLLALCAILYFGLPLLLRKSRSSSFIKQRGSALFFVFVCSTLFMQADKAHYMARIQGMLSAQDQLIRVLAQDAENARKAEEEGRSDNLPNERMRVASQWPSRTMIACKCDTLPLPPAAKDPTTQFRMLNGITHLILDPKQTENLPLTRNLSLLGGVIETLTLQPGGVILHIINNASPEGSTQQKGR